MIGRKTGITLFMALLVALVVCGAASTPAERAVADVGPVDAFSCGVPQEFVGYVTEAVTPSPVPRPAPGTIPDAFSPVKAVVCDNALGDHVAADGTTSYLERHYEGDFNTAIEAFNAPSERASLFPGGCGDYSLAQQVDMWLVDAHGNAMQPSYPLNDCGFENTLGLYEVQLLAETASVEHIVQIDTAGIGLYFSCASNLTPARPGPLSANEIAFTPSGFCRFDVSGPVPVFLGAQRYFDSSMEMSESFARSVAAQPCVQRANSVATATTFDARSEDWAPIEVQVELDGCRRILADGYTPLTAPEELLTALGS